MKAWSWFAVTPVVLAVAYSATPLLVGGLVGKKAEAVAIEPVNLPVAEVKPAAAKPADAADREIKYYVFGDLANGVRLISKPKPAHEVPVEFSLQSILMTNGNGVAVVDGRPVHQGDNVGSGYRVHKIEPNAVWLAIKRTRDVITKNKKGVKRTTKVTKDELRVLHFPEYRDLDLQATKLAASPVAPVPAASGQKPEQVELEKKYKQILEQLK